MNLDSSKIIVYGYRLEKSFHTHSWIHHGFFRSANFLRPGSLWLDQTDDLSGIDLADTLFITEHGAAMNLPIRDDCFYVVHGLNDNAPAREKFAGVKNRLSWNVYHDYSHVYGTQGNPVNDHVIGVPLTDVMWIGEEVPLYPKEHHMDFRWATDLLPHEIDQYKPDRILGIGEGYAEAGTVPARDRPSASKIIWYVGTQWWVNQRELNQFKKACDEDGVEFKPVGAGQNGIVSMEDNIRMVRESFFAPAIVGSHHITEGYAPCRIFKNISYGQYGVTNSMRVHQIFGEALIYHPDPYKLYFEARDRLSSMDVKHLHALMDVVKAKHTYVNRIRSIVKAAHIVNNS